MSSKFAQKRLALLAESLSRTYRPLVQLKEIIQKTAEFFKNKGIESARLDAELLIGSVLKLSRVELYLKFDYPLKESELDACRDLVRRRLTGEPVAYILGYKDFFKSTFIVSKDVLVPRPETEELVESALQFAKVNDVHRIIDLGTGSGCIGLSLIKDLPTARLLALDISDGALQIAGKNAEALQVQERVSFVKADAGELSASDSDQYLGGLADVVVANPPYISNNDPNVAAGVRAHEPATALFAENDGLREIERWAIVAGRVARPGAFVMFEIGAEQGQKAREIFSNTGKFERIEIVKDLSGRDRFIRSYKG